MRLGQLAGDCQAQSGAALRTAARAVRPVEALEDVGQGVIRDACPAVVHAQDDLLSAGCKADFYFSAVRRMAQGVVQQVVQDLLDALGVQREIG